ncbi:MAG: hypothetical protein ACRDSK_00520 [Actinophytocola sp.]|uniref:hypothetical protein n=1 Tax=Actinophytocola sp. TaxID=1872138 RepID=UPI003D6B55F4
MERSLAWDDRMVGEQAVHGIWGFAPAERALWQRIPRSARVKILPGTAFACPEPGRFRLCHATDASTVATSINRLIRALETS